MVDAGCLNYGAKITRGCGGGVRYPCMGTPPGETICVSEGIGSVIGICCPEEAAGSTDFNVTYCACIVY